MLIYQIRSGNIDFVLTGDLETYLNILYRYFLEVTKLIEDYLNTVYN